MTYLCKSLSRNKMTALFQEAGFLVAPRWYSYLFALGGGIIFTILGMVAPKGVLKSIIGFSVMYLLVYVSLVLWRIGMINV